MGSLTACLLLATALNSCLGYILEPSIAWPENYHFNAEEIDLASGVVKKFEMWYSEKFNRSRIDLNSGASKRFYYAPVETRDGYETGKVYFYHPETAEDEVPIIKCRKIQKYYGDQKCFLPFMFFFDYKGTEEHAGKEVSVWTSEVKMGPLKQEETLYVLQIAEGVGIPVQHVKKEYNLAKGEVTGLTIINYYNYDSDVKIESLQVDEEKCNAWNPYSADSMNILHPSIPGDLDIAFHSYKKHQNKKYVDKEHELRKKIFHRNWKIITETNNKNLGYTLTVNQFADKSDEELKYLSSTKVSGPIRGTHPFPHTVEELESMADNKEIPDEHDLRTEGVITPVRNQAECGSCWAFAAAATVEGALARSNGGRLIDLSEQSLVDCAWAYRSSGCQGSDAIDAVYDYILKNGMPTVREYGPYLMEDDVCKINNMTEVYHIKGFVAITPMNANALKAAIYKYGPVTIGVEVTRNMAHYNNGIFYDLRCSPGEMNHAVTLVGYGLRDGEPYWIVKNSWGEGWGEDGYILISARDNNCNVLNVPVYPLI